MWSTLLIALIMCGVAPQGAGHISGTVTDSSGNPLPDARITIEDRTTPGVVADSRGRFEIPDLPAGVYTVRATLPGFRTQSRSVSLREQRRAAITFVMTVDVLIEAQIPLLEPFEAVRRADAIVRVRLDGLAPPLPCAELVVVSAVHEATVLEVWKGRVPPKVQILEIGKGACVEGGRHIQALSGIITSYRSGGEYIVLLSGKGPRFGGLGLGSYVFPVDGQTVSTGGFMGLANTIGLREFQKRIRQLAQ